MSSMWKENFNIGDERIDNQHRQLFDMTEKLLAIVQGAGAKERKQECINAILFLKDYAVKHFAVEEEYQLSINYVDIEMHKALHSDFVETVLKSEQKLKDADFSLSSIKEFIGFLMTWLTYHVAGADQKLKVNEPLTDMDVITSESDVKYFSQSVSEVLNTLAGINAEQITFDTYAGNSDDVRILIELVGENRGDAVFTFTKEFTLSLIKAMTSIEVTEIDELSYSVLSELANIISGNASSLISAAGRASDNKTPQGIDKFNEADDRRGFYLDTEFGRMAVSVHAG